MVEMKNPGDQTRFSFQYTFSNHLNFFLSILADSPFNLPTTSEQLYFGGIIITRWRWSFIFSSIPSSSMITPAIDLTILARIFLTYSETPGFRMRRRYLVHQQTWYWAWYGPWEERIYFIPPLYRLRNSFTHA